MSPKARTTLVLGWVLSVSLAVALRTWNSVYGSLFHGYDAWGHMSYVLFLDMYHAVPYADQGWSYFHPPLHYLLGWLFLQSRDAEFAMIGISVVGSLASLGVAALAARVVWRAFPESSGWALLAFTAIAFLPVHVYTSPMPGNEMSATFLGAAAFAAHLRNESRGSPTVRGDLLTGLLCGLAMLTKFTALIVVLAIGATSLLRWLRAPASHRNVADLVRRSMLVGLPLLVLAGPYYGRNVLEFGTPMVTSAEVPDVARIQASQPPGERGVLDYLRFPLAIFEESSPGAPHNQGAVWPNVYLNVWYDTFREGQLPVPRDITIPHPFVHGLTLFMGALGLLPTLVAFLGAGLSARRAWRRPDDRVDTAMCILALGSLAAFVLFSVRIPTWAALKASYLLNLSLPFAWFLVRGAHALWRRGPALRWATPAVVALVAVVSSHVFAGGRPPGLMRRDEDSIQMNAIRIYLGQYASTRLTFGRNAPLRSYVETRAAAELYDGKPEAARRHYQVSGPMETKDPSGHPWWLSNLAVANALDGIPERARLLLDEAVDAVPEPAAEIFVNRAVVRLGEGDLSGAESDLRTAVALDPALPPAWQNLAFVLERRGRAEEGREARARFEELRWKAPRGFPYGVGNGFLYMAGAGQRFMLVVGEEGQPSLYRPPRSQAWPREGRRDRS